MQFLVRDHLPDPANVACNYKGIGSITPSTPTWALKGEDIAKFLKPLLLAATEKWKHMRVNDQLVKEATASQRRWCTGCTLRDLSIIMKDA